MSIKFVHLTIIDNFDRLWCVVEEISKNHTKKKSNVNSNYRQFGFSYVFFPSEKKFIDFDGPKKIIIKLN